MNTNGAHELPRLTAAEWRTEYRRLLRLVTQEKKARESAERSLLVLKGRMLGMVQQIDVALQQSRIEEKAPPMDPLDEEITLRHTR